MVFRGSKATKEELANDTDRLGKFKNYDLFSASTGKVCPDLHSIACKRRCYTFMDFSPLYSIDPQQGF